MSPKKILSVFLFVALGVVPVAAALLPSISYAQSGLPGLLRGGYWGKQPTLVPCGPGSSPYKACTNICQLGELAQRVTLFLATLGIYAVAPIMIGWGGITIMMGTSSLKDLGGGKSEKISKGKQIISGTITGILIILAAYLIIQTFLWMIGAAGSLSTGAPALGWPNLPSC